MSDDRRDELQLGESVEEGDRTITVRADWRPPSAAGSDAASPALQRAVLVKTSKPGIRLTPALVRVFRRQAERLGRMDHPLLPTLLDFSASDERVLLVFPDYGGVRLEALLDRLGRLDATATMAIGIEVARALSVIHRRGWVHGRLLARHVELNPSGTVRLFGPIRSAADEADGDGGEGDEILPLPEDMAPEQIIGEPADERTDVFLLGLLLYRMVAGNKAFHGGDGVGVAQRVRHGRAPRLTRRVPGVPPSLERVVAGCLCKRPRDRFADMPSVTTALIRALRATTAAPSEQLVNAALARADLAEPMEPISDDDGVAPVPWHRRSVLRVAVTLVAVLAVVVLLWTLVRAASEPAAERTSAVRGIEQQPAQLRVLARPWAEVHVDGKLIDVTPMAQPIRVTPGRHHVRFVHPHASDQVRTVEVIAGQTLWLDVTMAVSRPTPTQDAAADAATDATP